MRRLMVALLLVAGLLVVAPVSAVAIDVTQTEHVRLGFEAELPFDESISDSCCLGAADWSVGFSGSASLAVDMGADLELTYDPADLLDGGALPLAIGYTPTNDDGFELTLDVTGDFSLDFCVFAIVCDGDTVNDVTFVAGAGDFTAPLAGDAPVVIPLTSSTLTLSVAGIEVADAGITGSLTLSPVPAGALPGLGGAAAGLAVTGAGSLTAPTIPIVEWQTPGDQSATVLLDDPLSGEIDVTAMPVIHWLAPSLDLNLFVDLAGAINFFGFSDVTQNLISGGLGDELSAAGLDTLVGDAIGGLAGPLVADRIAAGFVPIPLLDPELAPIDVAEVPDLGSVAFTIDGDSDDDGLPDGEEIALGTDPFDPDTDDDGLLDGEEVDLGTDPLDADSDDDGIPDGEDTEFIENAVTALDDDAFKDASAGQGLRNALLRRLENAERAVARGNVDQAVHELENLRRHIDGCGAEADRNDWIVECAAQTQIRELVDLLIANLTA